MIKTITIKNISHENKVGKSTGKQFVSCRITVAGSGGKDVILSGFGSDVTRSWNAGDTVTIDTEQQGNYWNFKECPESKPSPNATMYLREISQKLDTIISKMSGEVKPTFTQEVEEITKTFGGTVIN